MYIEERSS